MAGDPHPVAADVARAPAAARGLGEEEHGAARVRATAQPGEPVRGAEQFDRLAGYVGQRDVAAELGVPAHLRARRVTCRAEVEPGAARDRGGGRVDVLDRGLPRHAALEVRVEQVADRGPQSAHGRRVGRRGRLRQPAGLQLPPHGAAFRLGQQVPGRFDRCHHRVGEVDRDERLGADREARALHRLEVEANPHELTIAISSEPYKLRCHGPVEFALMAEWRLAD